MTFCVSNIFFPCFAPWILFWRYLTQKCTKNFLRTRRCSKVKASSHNFRPTAFAPAIELKGFEAWFKAQWRVHSNLYSSKSCALLKKVSLCAVLTQFSLSESKASRSNLNLFRCSSMGKTNGHFLSLRGLTHSSHTTVMLFLMNLKSFHKTHIAKEQGRNFRQRQAKRPSQKPFKPKTKSSVYLNTHASWPAGLNSSPHMQPVCQQPRRRFWHTPIRIMLAIYFDRSYASSWRAQIFAHLHWNFFHASRWNKNRLSTRSKQT